MNITRKEYGIYGVGIAAQNILYNFMTMYMMFFFTDLLKIPSGTATIIVVVATVWDAINDPMMGMISDRTNTKIGKFRPYLIGGSVLILITTALAYSSFNLSTQGTVAVAAITYILWGMSFTISDIPIWAMSSVASDEPKERNKMISIGKIGGTLGVVICVLFSIQIINMFGGERSASAFFYTALIVGGIAALGILSVGLFVKERVAPPKNRIPFKENIKTVTKNKSLLLLIIILFLMNFVNSIRQVTQVYFTVYAWGDATLQTTIGISLVIGTLAGIIATPKLIERWDKKNIMIVAAIFNALFSVIAYINLQNITLGLISLGLSFVTIGVMIIASTSMLLDAVDYSEHKLGFRGDGIVFSLNTFVVKLGAAISKAVLGIGLILIHYVDEMAISKETIQMFSGLIYIVPAVVGLLMIIPLMFYKLDNKTMKEIESELKRRRTI